MSVFEQRASVAWLVALQHGLFPREMALSRKGKQEESIFQEKELILASNENDLVGGCRLLSHLIFSQCMSSNFMRITTFTPVFTQQSCIDAVVLNRKGDVFTFHSE